LHENNTSINYLLFTGDTHTAITVIWAAAGRFYGLNAGTCSLSSNMAGCIFLPTAGYRRAQEAGALTEFGVTGRYWSSTQSTSTSGLRLYFDSGNSSGVSSNLKQHAHTIRCVR